MTTITRARSRFRGAVAAATSLALLGLAGCASAAAQPAASDAPATETAPAAKTSFKVGVGADNPTEAAVVSFISETLAPEHGISVELVELEDSRHLNEAVNAGELDGHIALHDPYLQSVLAEQPDWELASAVPVYISILTIASKKHTTLEEIPDGATVSIPDDPSNEAKSLEFLEQYGLIKLNPVSLGTAAVEDIAENPHSIKIVKVVGQQLARSLEDVDYSVVQATYLRAASIGPEVEVVRAPQPIRLAITLVTRAENAQSEEFRLLRETVEDPKLDDYIDDNFGDIIAGVR